MDFKKSLFVLIAIILNAHVIECVTCEYRNQSLTYTCGIYSQIIDNENDMLQINGEHLSGRSNDDVERLEAKESEIHMFPSLIIDQFINLKYLELSNVKMKEISRPIKNCASLYYIFMGRNEFFDLPGGIFADCAELTHVHTENGRLRTIDANAFVGTKIRELYLTGNQIEVLQPSTFASIPSLSTLFCSDNMLTELPEDLFAKNQKLSFVVFDRNNLKSLPAKLLMNHTELHLIYLSGNRISKIHAETFANTPKLESLGFDQNLIEEIPEFTNLPKLRSLNFLVNKIKHVNAQTFKNLPSLENLYLAYNEIETVSLSINDSSYLPLLTKLDLSGNNITNITGMFESLPVNLTSLDLGYNQLTHLQAGTIHPMSQLRSLSLGNNQIRKIDPEFFRGATYLSVGMFQNECINSTFRINNELELNTTIAVLLDKCYNSGQQKRLSAVFVAFSVFFSFLFKFL